MKRKSTNLGGMPSVGSYEIGHCKLPVHLQRREGTPGNPAGKRPGAKSCTERDSSIDQYKETIAEFVY